jgi:hypothetical protein
MDDELQFGALYSISLLQNLLGENENTIFDTDILRI